MAKAPTDDTSLTLDAFEALLADKPRNELIGGRLVRMMAGASLSLAAIDRRAPKK